MGTWRAKLARSGWTPVQVVVGVVFTGALVAGAIGIGMGFTDSGFVEPRTGPATVHEACRTAWDDRDPAVVSASFDEFMASCAETAKATSP